MLGFSMCGRFVRFSPLRVFGDLFDCPAPPEMSARYNIATTQPSRPFAPSAWVRAVMAASGPFSAGRPLPAALRKALVIECSCRVARYPATYGVIHRQASRRIHPEATPGPGASRAAWTLRLPPEVVQALLRSFPAEQMESQAVGTVVNDPNPNRGG